MNRLKLLKFKTKQEEKRKKELKLKGKRVVACLIFSAIVISPIIIFINI